MMTGEEAILVIGPGDQPPPYCWECDCGAIVGIGPAENVRGPENLPAKGDCGRTTLVLAFVEEVP